MRLCIQTNYVKIYKSFSRFIYIYSVTCRVNRNYWKDRWIKIHSCKDRFSCSLVLPLLSPWRFSWKWTIWNYFKISFDAFLLQPRLLIFIYIMCNPADMPRLMVTSSQLQIFLDLLWYKFSYLIIKRIYDMGTGNIVIARKYNVLEKLRLLRENSIVHNN